MLLIDCQLPASSKSRATIRPVSVSGTWAPTRRSWDSNKAFVRECDTKDVVANIDVAPTILHACEASVPATARMDGRSFLPLLRGDQVNWRDHILYQLLPDRFSDGNEGERPMFDPAKPEKGEKVQAKADLFLPEPEFDDASWDKTMTTEYAQPLLADAIEAPRDVRAAVEAHLGQLLHAVLVRDWKAVRRVRAWLAERDADEGISLENVVSPGPNRADEKAARVDAVRLNSR